MSNDCSYGLQQVDPPQVGRQEHGLHFDRSPFALAPDAKLLFWTDTHRRAADTLRQGIEHASPVILLTGDTGTGKTTLVHDVLEDERLCLTIGFLPCIRGDRDGLCAWLLLAFGRQVPDGATLQFSSLREFLAAAHDAGRRCVLIVDEAQDATDDELEVLRLLTDLDCIRRTVLQVVLVGRPVLRSRLGDTGHASLAARIGADAHLSSISADSTAGYIRHRLASAGGRVDAFTPGALAAVHRIAQGIPGRINLLCGLCVTEARRSAIEEIDAALVRSVASAARQGGTFARLFEGEEVSGALSLLPDGIATAARPSGVTSLLAEAVAGTAREDETAGSRDQPVEHGIASPFPDVLQRRSKAPPPPANAPGRVEGRRHRELARDGAPSSSAVKLADKPPSTLICAAENVEEVRQLAFDAMARLADYDGDKASRPRRDVGSGRPLPPRADGTEEDKLADVRKDADPRPVPLIRPRRGAGLGLATAAVASALLGIGSYMIWSIHDALSAATGSGTLIAAATRESPPGTPSALAAHRLGEKTQTVGPDRAAGRGSDLLPHPVLTTPALPTIAAPDISAAGLFSLGLDLALADREAAAIAFARAASRGHERAAHYLAQIYETGDGVPRNVALARAWYAVSGSSRAGDHLWSVDDSAPPTAMSPPRLLSAARTSEGMLELVWTSATQGRRVQYLIEVLDGLDQSTIHAARVTQSSYRLAAPEGKLLWRVTAEGPATALASDLQRIPPAN